MAFEMMKLPYEANALAPYISEKTLNFHYGKHYKKYVTTLNELIKGTHYESLPIENIIVESFREQDKIFDNAGQVWNHEFYFNGLTPEKTKPSEITLDYINTYFGSLGDFKELFLDAAAGLFGSGWVWLVKTKDGDLTIEAMKNAGTPLTQNQTPLLTCDVWEHAYYLDYQNERPKYLSQFWRLINWDFVAKNLATEPKYFEQHIKKPSQETYHDWRN